MPEGGHEDEREEGGKQAGSKRGRGQRGIAKKVEGRHIITEVDEDGRPVAPEDVATKFVHQCGWVVRDHVPISKQNWRTTRAENDSSMENEESYVADSQKDLLWTTLLDTFTLQIPQNLHARVKEWALKKMATQFQTFNTSMFNKYVLKELTPNFDAFPKLKDHWDAFVQYKLSEEGTSRIAKNKANAARKKYFHRLGSGGYKKAIPKWQKMEETLAAKGIILATAGWPE